MELFREQVRNFDDESRYEEALKAGGEFSLVTEPPGAEVYVFRFVERDDRLWPDLYDVHTGDIVSPALPRDPPHEPSEPESVAPSAYRNLPLEPRNLLGKTPIGRARLRPGSYLLFLRHQECRPVRYPILIERNKDATPHKAIRLWTEEEYPPGGPEKWVWIPPGRSILGGDPEAYASWDRKVVEIDGFFMVRFEVTCEEYLEFVNAPESAERKKKFELPKDVNVPVTNVSWKDASAYVEWRTRHGGGEAAPFAFRLPEEEQWERAARGADARFYPWGNGFDVTFCRGASRGGGRILPADESPFGVRDLAGSVWEWCENWYDDGQHARALRGGVWSGGNARGFRSADRDGSDPSGVGAGGGFRVMCVARAPK